MQDFDNFLAAKNIAIVGVSRDNKKVGHVIFRNFVDAKYNGSVYPVNISGEEILGQKTYKSILEIKEKLDLVIVAVPAAAVFSVIEQTAAAGTATITRSSFSFISSIDLY